MHAVVDGATVTVLPGGLGRVLDPAVPIVTQSSGLAKDVWVVDGRGARPADRSPTHLRAGPLMPQVDLRGSLPTRAAEALFWLGRRAERAEGVARLARAVLARSQHDPGLLDAAPWVAWATAGLRSIRGVVPGDAAGEPVGVSAEVRAALVGPGGLAEQLELLRRAASAVREFLSSTTWQVLEGLRVDAGAPADTLDRVVVGLSALAGLAMESTVRGPSWRLLDLGRRLERALVVLAAVESMLGPAPDELTAGSRYEVVLTAHESLVAYRRRYRSDTRIDAVLDLLLGDDTNPRALAFQLDRMAEHLAALPGPVDRSRLEQLLDATARAVVRAPWQEIDDSAAPIAATARTHDHRGAGPRRTRSAAGPGRRLRRPLVRRPGRRPADGFVPVTRYWISHRTSYRYGASMSGGHSVLHLVPRATATQTVVSSVVRCEPEADEVSTWVDAFGNLVTYLGVHHPHEALEVQGTSEVAVEEPAPPDGVAMAWEEVGARLAEDPTEDALLARVCRLESPSSRRARPSPTTPPRPSRPPGRSSRR